MRSKTVRGFLKPEEDLRKVFDTRRRRAKKAAAGGQGSAGSATAGEDCEMSVTDDVGEEGLDDLPASGASSDMEECSGKFTRKFISL